MFVVSTPSAAAGLPLGVVVTSDKSSSTINTAMTQLHSLFPIGSCYGEGGPENIITDDEQGDVMV